MRQRSLMTDAMSGAAAGLAAAFLMNCFQIAWNKASSSQKSGSGGEDDENSSEPATVRAVEKFQAMASGRPLPEGERQIAGNLLHFGFGAVLGVIYVAVGRRYSTIRSGYGTAYGAGVSIGADEILVPAAGLSPPPTKSSAWSHAFGLVSHVVFGAALEGSRRLIARAAG